MIIFSHRGISKEGKHNFPENTKEALLSVLKSGFSVEVDVRETKDGEIIICHNPELKGRKLKDLKLDQLKQAGLYPFEELCEDFKLLEKSHLKVAVHMKEHEEDFVKKVVRKITEQGLEKSFFVFDVTRDTAKLIKGQNDGIEVGISISERDKIGGLKTIYSVDSLKGFKYFDIIWWDEWESGKLYNKENYNLIKKLFPDKEIFVVSFELHSGENHKDSKNLKSIFKRFDSLRELVLDGVCTDYPFKMGEFLNKKTLSNPGLNFKS